MEHATGRATGSAGGCRACAGTGAWKGLSKSGFGLLATGFGFAVAVWLMLILFPVFIVSVMKQHEAEIEEGLLEELLDTPQTITVAIAGVERLTGTGLAQITESTEPQEAPGSQSAMRFMRGMSTVAVPPICEPLAWNMICDSIKLRTALGVSRILPLYSGHLIGSRLPTSCWANRCASFR